MHTASIDQTSSFAMTIADVTRRTGIGRTALFEAIRFGKLRAMKAGARTLIEPKDLDAFLDSLPDVAAGRRWKKAARKPRESPRGNARFPHGTWRFQLCLSFTFARFRMRFKASIVETRAICSHDPGKPRKSFASRKLHW